MGGKVIPVRWAKVEASTSEGAGALPVLRVAMTSRLSVAGGSWLEFQDGNFASRTGWKEIVIQGADGVEIQKASQTNRDLSQALTKYPADLTAKVLWHVDSVAVSAKAPTALSSETPKIAVAASAPFSAQQPVAAGTA